MTNNKLDDIEILTEVNRLARMFSEYLKLKVIDGEIVQEFIENTPQKVKDAHRKFHELTDKYPDILNIR